jgi:hypothetical protein
VGSVQAQLRAFTADPRNRWGVSHATRVNPQYRIVIRQTSGSDAMATGAGLLRRAREHIHEQYVNTQVPKDDPNWKGPWDCAEFISWLVFQEAGILYGCVDDNAKPSQADAYTGAWQTDLMKRGTRVSVDEAAATVGGIVLRYPPGPGKMGHIALCDGKGGTVEAKGRLYGLSRTLFMAGDGIPAF